MRSNPDGDILIIDDHEEWLDFSEKTLEVAGYRVAIARNVPDASRILLSSAKRISLIVVDLKQVRQNQVAFQRMIAETHDGRKLVVVVVAATLLTSPLVNSMLKMGVQDCVDKVYDSETLLRLVETQLAGAGLCH